MLSFSWWLLGVTALGRIFFFFFFFFLMHCPSAPFASEQVPTVHLSPVLASLGSPLATRRDASVA